MLNRLVTITVVASILLIPTGATLKTFGDETNIDSDKVNEIGIKATFHFGAKQETIQTFKYFDTLSSGFDRTKPLAFTLQGVVGSDRPLLYQAVDTTYSQGKNQQNPFTDFDVDIILHHVGEPVRQLSYKGCQVSNYNIITTSDKLTESYNQKFKFAFIDKFEFLCRGFELHNPLYDNMMKNHTNIINQKNSTLTKDDQRKK